MNVGNNFFKQMNQVAPMEPMRPMEPTRPAEPTRPDEPSPSTGSNATAVENEMVVVDFDGDDTFNAAEMNKKLKQPEN